MQTFSSPGVKPNKSITLARSLCVCVEEGASNPDLKTSFSKDHHGSGASDLQMELLVRLSCSFFYPPNTQFES